ncbi:MAG: helix-turn-helix domain-containing protein [Candidatus Aenigmarchaeota archaeon]|nr:helix-turn-helix domain-containing protein [Candidatus Aenigmarchaeota archaeon]
MIEKIINSLLYHKFQVLVSEGAFDIAAKKDFLMLIKALINVDALTKEQALSLKAISYFLSAYPLIISLKTNREFLRKEIVYSRFNLPVITPYFFEKFLEEERIPEIEATKGKHVVAIDTEVLKNRRKELGFTLDELSKLVGITKKALYEIENKRVNPSIETVRNLEKTLKVDLKLSFKLKACGPTYLKPKDNFQEKISKEFSRIGLNNSPTYSAPFEIVGREKFSMIVGLSKNTRKIEKDAVQMKRMSFLFSSKCAFVAKKCEKKSIEDVPIILTSEIPEIESVKELEKLMEEKIE